MDRLAEREGERERREKLSAGSITWWFLRHPTFSHYGRQCVSRKQSKRFSSSMSTPLPKLRHRNLPARPPGHSKQVPQPWDTIPGVCCPGQVNHPRRNRAAPPNRATRSGIWVRARDLGDTPGPFEYSSAPWPKRYSELVDYITTVMIFFVWLYLPSLSSIMAPIPPRFTKIRRKLMTTSRNTIQKYTIIKR